MDDRTLSQAVFQRVRDVDGRTWWLLKETVNYFWPGEPEVSEVEMASVFEDLRHQGVDVVLSYEDLEVVPEPEFEDETPPLPEPGPRGRSGGRD